MTTVSLDLSFAEKLLMMTLFPRTIFIPSATSELVIFFLSIKRCSHENHLPRYVTNGHAKI